MKIIRKFVHSISIQETKILGRWKLENCIQTMHNKVDLANEDHCGTCSGYRLSKKNSYPYLLIANKDKDTKEDELEEDEYIRFMM